MTLKEIIETFMQQVDEFYGEIDLNKVDPERVKDSVDQII